MLPANTPNLGTQASFTIAALLILFVLAFSPAQAYAELETTGLTVVSKVKVLESDQLGLPTSSAPWTEVELPIGNRIGNSADKNRVLWIHFQLDSPADDNLRSLYFYRYNQSIDVFFNGTRIGGDNRRPGWHTVAWNHPNLIDIQAANWRRGVNEVHVRFEASYYGGTFSEVLFAERDELLPLYEQAVFRQLSLNEWLQTTGVIVTALGLALWLSRRNDPIYLLFAGMALCWTVLTTHMVLYYSLVDYRYWLPLVHFAADCFAALLFFLLAQLTNLPVKKSGPLVVACLPLSVLWNSLGPYEIWWIGAYLVHSVFNLFTFYLLTRIVHKAYRQRTELETAVSVTLLFQLALFSHDLSLTLFADGDDWENAIYLAQFAFPVLLVVFSALLLQRFVGALKEAEQLNRNLEAKVESSRKIIEQSYADRRGLELQQAAAKERALIYRDLHDDVGSKLLSIAHAGRDNRLGDLARSALQSLRDAVSRANSPAQPLGTFIKELKEEATLRLEGSGHRVSWRESGLLSDAIINAETVFNINQIVRELVSNIIRHARASEVSICLDIQDDTLSIAVSDNGIGLNGRNGGNGIANINQRASELGASVDWLSPTSGGLTVKLTKPGMVA